MSIDKHIEEHIVLGLPFSAKGLAKVAHPQNTVVLIGDSITLQGDYTDSPTAPTIITRNACGYFHRANIRLGAAFTNVINKGVGGDTTTGMLARFSADVIANTPGWVAILGGTNDIYFGGGSAGQVATSVATAWANIKTMISMSLNSGIRVILSTNIPRGNWGTVATMSRGLMQLNHKIKEYAAANPSIILTDPYVAMLDTSTTTTILNGTPLTANYFADSGPVYVHPNTKGGRVMGDILYTALSPVIPRVDARIIGGNNGSVGDMDNLFVNGMLAGGATLATSWNSNLAVGATLTGTNAKTTRWDSLPGPVQRVTCTLAPALGNDLSDTAQWRIYNAQNSIATYGLAVGDQCFCEAESDVTETAGSAMGTFLYIILNPASGPYVLKVYGNYPSSGSTGQNIDWNDAYIHQGVIRTPVFTIPATCTQILPMAYMVTSAGATIQYDWARFQLRKVQT